MVIKMLSNMLFDKVDHTSQFQLMQIWKENNPCSYKFVCMYMFKHLYIDIDKNIGTDKNTDSNADSKNLNRN